MKVTLRQRTKGNKVSLYLDYYHKGKRDYEYLELYLIPEPEKGKLTKAQKETNKETLALAESIRSKRQLEIQNGRYGFLDHNKLSGSFIDYIINLAQKRKDSPGNYNNWDSAIKHLQTFSKMGVTFEQVDKDWLERFRDYLQKVARKPNNEPLSDSSQSSYFNKVRTALKQAYADGIISKNPCDQVKTISIEEKQREFLTQEELQSLVNTEFEIPLMKTVFIFSALTGLRWSDIQKLVWSEIQHSSEFGYYIRFKQKKTKGAETLPISEQAVQLLGERKGVNDKVFEGLVYNAYNNIRFHNWIKRAGITKHITFHCGRHTNATLLLTLGSDIYTVSKLLGHKNLKTTQVYAKIIDEKKKEAANKIVLNL